MSNTEGFEDHYDELKAFEDAQNNIWELAALARKQQAIKQLKENHGDDIWNYVYYLEQQLKDYHTIKEQVQTLVDQCIHAGVLDQEDKII